MKYYKIISRLFLTPLLLVILSFQVIAQTDTKTVYVNKGVKKLKPVEGIEFVNVDKNPRVNPEVNFLATYMMKNIKINKLNKDSLKGNMAIVRFNVSEEGKVKNVKFIKRVEPSVDNQIKELLESLPDYTPGEKNGQKVTVQQVVTIPISKIKRPKKMTPLKGGMWSAEFPTGNELLPHYIAGQLKYPKGAAEEKIQGRVVLTFTISKLGEIVDIETKKSVSPECDAEAIRVVKEMPNWLPALEDGEPVFIDYTLPIVFRLNR